MPKQDVLLNKLNAEFTYVHVQRMERNNRIEGWKSRLHHLKHDDTLFTDKHQILAVNLVKVCLSMEADEPPLTQSHIKLSLQHVIKLRSMLILKL